MSKSVSVLLGVSSVSGGSSVSLSFGISGCDVDTECSVLSALSGCSADCAACPLSETVWGCSELTVSVSVVSSCFSGFTSCTASGVVSTSLLSFPAGARTVSKRANKKTIVFVFIAFHSFSAAIVMRNSISGKGVKRRLILHHRAYLLCFGMVRFSEIDWVRWDSCNQER